MVKKVQTASSFNGYKSFMKTIDNRSWVLGEIIISDIFSFIWSFIFGDIIGKCLKEGSLASENAMARLWLNLGKFGIVHCILFKGNTI